MIDPILGLSLLGSRHNSVIGGGRIFVKLHAKDNSSYYCTNALGTSANFIHFGAFIDLDQANMAL